VTTRLWLRRSTFDPTGRRHPARIATRVRTRCGLVLGDVAQLRSEAPDDHGLSEISQPDTAATRREAA
ncbi:MAG: hypothetical protein AAGG46_07155, partial [Planctomycetota bacterium]